MNRWIAILSLACSASVLGAQTCNDAVPATTPNSRFSVYGAEVIDQATGLVWQRCALGQTGADCSGGSAGSYTWQQALQAAEDEREATGRPWRLPNRKELSSIVEERCYNPAINLTVFPNAPSSYYWSASPYAGSTNGAWGVDFYDGNSYGYTKGNGRYVRLVRGGQ
jgi:hypothetical protein